MMAVPKPKKEITLSEAGPAIREAAYGAEPVFLTDGQDRHPVAVLMPIALYHTLAPIDADSTDELPDAEVAALSTNPKVAAILARARQSGYVDSADAWRELGVEPTT